MNAMTKLTVALVALLLASCANYSGTVTKTNTDGTTTTNQVKIFSLWRKVERLEATYGTLAIKIGSLSSEAQAEDIMTALCTLYPALSQCFIAQK